MRNLILAGFMATGKTSTGKHCAQMLGYEFVDTDIEIERREGLSVPQIFAAHGEAYFRAKETELVREIASREGLVVATGGGMIVNDANRMLLLKSGVCVNLMALPETILQRVGADAASKRPMLQGGEPKARIAQLLKERAPKYGQLHYHVHTDGMTPFQIAEQITQLYAHEHERISVAHPNGTYDLVVGENLIDQIGFMLAGRGFAQVAVVADENTATLFGERICTALTKANLPNTLCTLPAGEAHKHLQSVEKLYGAFSQAGLARDGAVIALGGGVIGDTAGFAAATYLRGVPLVQVPTSLLAMADSGIGGKVGVDTAFGKNLVGAFKQPELVIIDLNCLQTLPEIELRCGLAEIIKAGLIKGDVAWQRLAASTFARESVSAILLDAIHLKREVVEEDPYEKGRRALLNLGHTFGHGIEYWSQFNIKHGEAVALGMVCALRASQALGFCDGVLVGDVIALLQRAGLPTTLAQFPELVHRFDADAIWHIMQSDKKKANGKVNFILIKQPGACFISGEVTETLAKEILTRLTAA